MTPDPVVSAALGAGVVVARTAPENSQGELGKPGDGFGEFVRGFTTND
jgi:hypothetical protein